VEHLSEISERRRGEKRNKGAPQPVKMWRNEEKINVISFPSQGLAVGGTDFLFFTLFIHPGILSSDRRSHSLPPPPPYLRSLIILIMYSPVNVLEDDVYNPAEPPPPDQPMSQTQFLRPFFFSSPEINGFIIAFPSPRSTLQISLSSFQGGSPTTSF
jgi:hypothetical protein